MEDGVSFYEVILIVMQVALMVEWSNNACYIKTNGKWNFKICLLHQVDIAEVPWRKRKGGFRSLGLWSVSKIAVFRLQML